MATDIVKGCFKSIQEFWTRVLCLPISCLGSRYASLRVDFADPLDVHIG